MATQHAAAPGTHSTNIPVRQASATYDAGAMSDDEAIPTADPKDTTELLAERLRAWKHFVGYLENYVTATEKVEKAHAKEYEKVLKTIADPLKEGHHFDQSLGGIAGLLENMRTNTQSLSNSHAETEKNLKGSVLPILERLHKEIKNKSKELSSGAGKSAKEVDKARNTTQKHIELLGQQTAAFGSTGGKITAADDPYVVHRGVYHRLNKQIMEENNNRNDTISVQNNFAAFEAHIIEVIQQALASFNQFVGGQAQKDTSLYGDMLSTAQRISPDFEWKGFVQRNGNLLVDPNSDPRSINNVSFPNQNHKATQPMIEGTLERKSRSMLSTGYSTGYYVVTPSKFLHEFKDNDNFRKDPSPELSIYLPDATIGSPNGLKFNVKGKDVSKGFAAKLSGSSEVAFKAHTDADAQKWFEVIKLASGSAPVAYESAPTSPVDNKVQPAALGAAVSPAETASPTYAEKPAAAAPQVQPAPVQTQGLAGGSTVVSPTSATSTTMPSGTMASTASPQSATQAHAPEKI